MSIQNKKLVEYNHPVYSFNSSLKKPKNTIFDAKDNQLNNDQSKELKQYIKLLQAAYCDEWIAVYQYSIGTDFLNKLNFNGLISDKMYHSISAELMIHSTEELNHAKLIVPELIRLNSEPIYQIDMLQLTSNGQLDIPEKNTLNVLNQNLKAETNAIKVYSDIIDFAKKSSCASHKFQDTLKYIRDQEEEHQSDIEKIIREFKELKNDL